VVKVPLVLADVRVRLVCQLAVLVEEIHQSQDFVFCRFQLDCIQFNKGDVTYARIVRIIINIMIYICIYILIYILIIIIIGFLLR